MVARELKANSKLPISATPLAAFAASRSNPAVRSAHAFPVKSRRGTCFACTLR